MARWRQTLVAAIGVCFSITMFIALLSFMTGLNQWLDGLVANRIPHIRFYNEVRQNPEQPITLVPSFQKGHHFVRSVKTTISREEIHNSIALINALKQNGNVVGVAPKIEMVVLFNNGSARLSGTVNGIQAEAENNLFHFSEYVIQGNSTDLAVVPNGIILGKVLAEKLSVELGDPVYLTTSAGTVFVLKLVGLYQSGINDLDKVVAYTSLATTQKMLGKPAHYITDIQVKLHHMEEAPRLAKEFKLLTGIEALDIQTANAEFATGNFVRSLISYLVGITLLIVAGFGIYNILNMMIYEKMDSIAILKATGFSGIDVRRIFLIIALSIGLSGGLAGLVLGYLFSAIIDVIPFEVPSLPTVKTYPVNYDLLFYGIALVFSVLTTYLAGLFPATKAARVDPVVIIRGK